MRKTAAKTREAYPQVAEAQRDVREVYVGGFFGQLVSGIVWLVAAAMATWVSAGAGVGTSGWEAS